MKHVVVDLGVCQGHAACMMTAPALFDLDVRGNAVVLGDGSLTDDAAVDLARRAQAACPERAISIVGD
jgi:ferredoxin